MERRITRLLSVGLFAVASAALADDVQVPMDTAGQVLSVNGARASAAGLFTEYPGLVDAYLYQDGDQFTLEVTQRKDGRVVRHRETLSQEQVDQLRKTVSEKLATVPSAPAVEVKVAPAHDEAARWALIGISTAASLGYYAWAFPVGAGITGSPAFGTYTVIAAAGFFVPFGLTFNTPVTWGMANALYAGLARGPLHSLLGVRLLAPSSSLETYLLTSVFVGAGEAAGWLTWSILTNASAGTVHASAVASDIGLLAGLGIGGLIDGTSLDPNQLHAGFALGGAIAGAVGGAFYARMKGWYWGDSEFMWASFLLGGYAMVPVIGWTNVTDNRAFAGLELVGALGGATAGYFLLGDRHLDVGQSVLIDLGTVAGGLLGLGAIALTAGFTDWKPAVTVSAAAAIGAYALTYLTLVPRTPGASTYKDVSVHLQLNPTALVMPKAETAERPPLLSLAGSF